MNKIKYGLIGLGFGRNVHIPAFSSDPRFDLISVCSRREQKVFEVMNQYGIPHGSTDPLDVIERCDTIAFALPPLEQLRFLPLAIEKGCHVFFEKPLGQCLDLNIKNDRQAVISDFEFMEIDVWKKLKNIIDENLLGELKHAEVTWNVETFAVSNSISHWKTLERDYGGALNNFGSHVLYYLEHFFGKISEISAVMKCREGFADDSVFLISKMENEMVISVSINIDSYQGSGHRIELTGSRGSAILKNKGTSTVSDFDLHLNLKDKNNESYISEWKRLVDHDDRIEAVACLVKKFGDWIELGIKAQPNLNSALRVQYLINCCRESHLLKKMIRT